MTTIERIKPTYEYPFAGLVLKSLEGQKQDRKPNAVIAIDGLPGAGTTTTSRDLARQIEQQTGLDPIVISMEEKLHEEILYPNQALSLGTIHRQADEEIAREMLNPDYSGRLIIVEGARSSLVAKLLQMTGKELRAQGRIDNFPVEIITSCLFRDRKLRESRSQREQLPDDASQIKKAIDAYPDFHMEATDIFSYNSDFYDLYFDTEELTPNQTATGIFKQKDFNEKLLPLLDYAPTA